MCAVRRAEARVRIWSRAICIIGVERKTIMRPMEN